VRRQRGVPEKDHEVRQVAVILTQLPSQQHQVHPERVAAEREKEALPQLSKPV